jgi:hypothetical protein
MMKKLRAVAAVVLLCFAVFFCTRFYYSRHVKTVEYSKETEITGETIRSKMSNIGKLSTAEYSYTHLERVDSSRQINGFNIPLTKTTFIYSYDGIIRAGVDFTQIKVEKDDDNKVITVTLPEVEIISSDVDQDSFQLYDEKNNIFNPINVTDITDSFADLKNTEEEKAVNDGLLDKAKTNAVTLIENFMRGSFDVEDYDIVVQ